MKLSKLMVTGMVLAPMAFNTVGLVANAAEAPDNQKTDTSKLEVAVKGGTVGLAFSENLTAPNTSKTDFGTINLGDATDTVTIDKDLDGLVWKDNRGTATGYTIKLAIGELKGIEGSQDTVIKSAVWTLDNSKSTPVTSNTAAGEIVPTAGVAQPINAQGQVIYTAEANKGMGSWTTQRDAQKLKLQVNPNELKVGEEGTAKYQAVATATIVADVAP